MGFVIQVHFILGGTSLLRSTIFRLSGFLVYRETARRVILVRAALFSVEDAARISRESVPNDGGVIKEHDGSMSAGLASYQGHFPVDDRAFAYLSSAKVRRERERLSGARNTNGVV